MTLMSVSAVTAGAEDTDDKMKLPSGKSLRWSVGELESSASERGGSFDYASAAVGIIQGNEILYEGYLGETDRENGIKADAESVYEWGSITKTFIWVSAMQLWEQGKLDLDKDVREYLPDGFFKRLKYDDPITMLNLMNHNAGWQETTRVIWKSDKNDIMSLGEELQACEPAQTHRPGEVSAYSNYGAGVAGYVIECISGMSFGEYVRKNIFEPLGMEHTAINPAHDDVQWVYDKRSQMKSYQSAMGKLIDRGNCLDYVTIYPAGSAAGTLSDMMTYAQALLDDDAPLFQNKETQEIMFTPTAFYGNTDVPKCAHGFWFSEYNVRTVGHNGGTQFGQSDMLLDLESKTGLCLMTNDAGGNWVMDYAPKFVFGTLSADKYGADAKEPAKNAFSGYYMPSRSYPRGMLRVYAFLGAVNSDHVGEYKEIGDGLYQFESALGDNGLDGGTEAQLFGRKVYPDGKIGMEYPSIELIHEDFYALKLLLLSAYLLVAVAAVFHIITRLKLRRKKLWKPFAGSKLMLAGTIGGTASVVLLLVTFALFANGSGSIEDGARSFLGIGQMICAGFCGISALIMTVPMFGKSSEKASVLRYVLGILSNAVTVSAIFYFQMYCFWDC